MPKTKQWANAEFMHALVAGAGVWTISGAPPGHDARIIRALACDGGRRVLFVLSDDARMEAAREALAFFAPALDCVSIPAWDCLPYDRVSPNPEIAGLRAAALAGLAQEEESAPKSLVVLTTLNALLQKVPPVAELCLRACALRAGGDYPRDELRDFFVREGFRHSSVVSVPGTYAFRGGLVDVYPPEAEAPVRLDFFDDRLESLHRFDPDTQKRTRQIDELRLLPARECALTEESITRFRTNYEARFGAPGGSDSLYTAIAEEMRPIAGMEHLLPLFHDRMETLFDYLPDACVVFDHGTDAAAMEARLAQIETHYKARAMPQKLHAPDETGASSPLLPPDALYLTAEDLNTRLAAHKERRLSPFEMEAEKTCHAGAKPVAPLVPAEGGIAEALGARIKALQAAGKRILIAASSQAGLERFERILEQTGFKTLTSIENIDELENLPKPAPALCLLRLPSGFDAPDVCVISEADVFGRRLVSRLRKRQASRRLLAEALAWAEGDFVAHVEHGIGRFEGLRRIDAAGAAHDCLVIRYADEATLFVPVENTDLVSRYAGEGAQTPLDRLGASAWQARKARVKKHVEEMARRLVATAAMRTGATAPRLHAPPGLYDDFCARFPYEETHDQEQAIEAVIRDLAQGRPMDRLICGDVGFGKTEVALRAAFICVMSGYQAAILAPTTLLARQHLATFRKRFEGLPVRVGALSRLVSAADAKDTRAALKDGTLDIIIGTHALLSEKTEMHNPGLLVIDEEQRFGVAHKERIKEMKRDIHVLTLTATPIPRSLQLALSGAKEMSLIATPPADRLSVRSFVGPFDSLAIRTALMRETERGGRAFFICPRIRDVARIKAFLHEALPDAAIVAAHGQMPPPQIEETIAAFYDGRADVLVSTDIVESGLDIPEANTLVVYRAHMFGLAQLHQLRGRVGRSGVRAYAYFTLPTGIDAKPQIQKRLGLLQSLDSLGAGFTLAAQDLDMRGAGNLLGTEQSGHIREIGYELYQKMLEDAVAALRTGKTTEASLSPHIRTGVPVLIPDDYVDDPDLRLRLYRQINALDTEADIGAFGESLADRFGPVPDTLRHLLDVVRIKGLCRQAGVDRCEGGSAGARVHFHQERFANPDGLLNFITEEGARLTPDHTLIIRRDWEEAPARLEGMEALMRKLAALATLADMPTDA